MGQPCKDYDDPNSPEPDPALGNVYLSPDQIKKQLEMLRTGRYRLKTIAARFGQTAQSIGHRMRRHPELKFEYDAARAEGEMVQCDKLFDGSPLEAEAAKFYLERIHRVIRPVDAARIAAYNAEAKARQEGGGDLERQQALRRFLAAASAESEGDPTANADNAGEPGDEAT
jgi:hypothetical protein